MIKTLWYKLQGKVKFREVTKIRVLGQVYPLVSTVTHGSSENFKTTYIIKRTMMVNHESARDYDELVEIESMDVQEFISEDRWVDKDSLEGILSLVTFDLKHLKDYKNGKSNKA